MTDRSPIAPMAVAACVAAVFFILVVTMLIVVFAWNKWYQLVQRRRGRVKVPRDYWQQKKLRAQRGVAKGSVKSQAISRDNRTTGAGTQAVYDNPLIPRDNPMMPPQATLYSHVSIVPGSVRKPRLKIEEIPEPDYEMVGKSNVVKETLRTLSLDPDVSVTPM